MAAAPGFVPVPTVPAGAVREYVALGDSYTAGPGIPVQTGLPAGCVRSDHNYPSLVEESLQPTLFRDVSCSGAATVHLGEPQQTGLGTNKPQLDALTEQTDLVTLGIGGNDIGFGEILSTCARLSATHPLGAACRDHYRAGGRDALADRIRATGPKITVALAQIANRSPNARILVVGYPTILPDTGDGCYPLVPFSPQDVSYLRDTAKGLNAMLAQRAQAAGAEFVDLYTPSIGHDVCQLPGTKWVEGLVPTSPAAPAHPNALGMRAAAQAVLGTLYADVLNGR
jgi:lysophospholipase L1-like esterase